LKFLTPLDSINLEVFLGIFLSFFNFLNLNMKILKSGDMIGRCRYQPVPQVFTVYPPGPNGFVNLVLRASLVFYQPTNNEAREKMKGYTVVM
jgi:hypothetical protein